MSKLAQPSPRRSAAASVVAVARPASVAPVMPQPALHPISAGDDVSSSPVRGNSAVQGRLLRQLSAQKQFENATRPLHAEQIFCARVEDASHAARAAMRDTDALLERYLTAPRVPRAVAVDVETTGATIATIAAATPATGAGGSAHRPDADEILRSVDFELECLDTVAASLDQLDQIAGEKLQQLRHIVDHASVPDPALLPLLARHEVRQRAACSARQTERAQIEKTLDARITQLTRRLEQALILPLH